ncbi:MAG: tetratricopeptide repeat protein [Gammaproteobacteria bacterium]
MDALKKAEQDKKRAAERLRQVEAGERREAEKDSSADTHDAQSTGSYQTGADSTGHGLTAIASDTGRHQIFPETVQLSLQPINDDEIKTPETASESVLDSNEAEPPVSDVDEAQILSEDATIQRDIILDSVDTEKLPTGIDATTGIEELSAETASPAFDDTFHGVVLGEKADHDDAYNETLPGVTAFDLVKDIGDGETQPTPVAAQTVFTASASARPGQSFKWSLYIALGVMAVMAFGVFYYYTITPVSRQVTSPVVARGIETTIAPPFEIAMPQEVAVGTLTPVVPAGEQSRTETIVDSGVSEDTMIETEQIAENTGTPVEPAEDINIVADELQASGREPAIVETDELERELVIEIPEQQEEKILPDRIDVEPASIQISKTRSPERHSIAINQAYEAYLAGRHTDAEAAYKEVLSGTPDNRDALLGLAAIAMKNGDYELAYKHYLHLLDLNPGDSVALTAMVNLSEKTDPVKGESAIKILLAQEPDAAYLYFALGNLYASQLRWAEAQQAFFDAHRQESGNPDYALNLAVSLDHIGQYEPALDYYNVALELAGKNNFSFDTISVISRIQALSGVVDPQL